MAITRVSKFPNPIAVPPWVMAPNGGQVFYLCSLGVQDGTQDDIASSLYTTLGAALGACRANRGDTIIALPGHVENVVTTPTFKAGVSIIGIGNGDERPTFTWTATASQWSIAVANVSIQNCIMNLAGTAATATTKAIVITGARSVFKDNRFILGASSTQQATIGIEYGTGGDRGHFEGNNLISTTDAAVVSCIKIVAALDRLNFTNNIMTVGMSATTNGLITMTVAPTSLYIGFNSISNTITNSTKALVAITAATGVVEYNNLYLTNATGGATAFGTPGSLGANQNFGCATNGSGLLTPAAGS